MRAQITIKCWVIAGLLLAGCSTRGPLQVADYRMEPWRPSGAPSLSRGDNEQQGPPRTHETRTAEMPLNNGLPPDAIIDSAGRSGARILRPGSRVEVRLRGIPNPESFNDQVDEMGEITLPHLGAIRVAGLPTSQAERYIERTYTERRIFRSINVIITTPEEEYFVQGEVRRPGKYIVTRNLTLLQAISEAGGFTAFASRRRVRVMSEDGSTAVHNAHRIAQGRSADVPIEPKDVIDVPRRWW